MAIKTVDAFVCAFLCALLKLLIKQKSFAPFVVYPRVKSRSTVRMHVQVLRGSHSKVLSATVYGSRKR